MTDPRPVPPISREMREHAKVQPSSWLYVLDPAADVDGEVPPELVVGAFPVDEHGELGEAFEHNPRYVPSELPAPTDPLDAALQDLASGRGSHEAVLALLRTAELLLEPGQDDALVVHTTPARRDVVQAYSCDQHAPDGGGPGWRRRRGRELARLLPPGVDLQLNPGSALAVTIPRASLLR